MDFYHLRENLQKSRRIVFGEESAQGKTWLEDVMHTFRHAGYDSAWDRLVTWRSPLRSPTKRKEANRLISANEHRSTEPKVTGSSPVGCTLDKG